MNTERAFQIVLELAEHNVLAEIPKMTENNEQRKEQLKALNHVRNLSSRLLRLIEYTQK